MSLPGIEPDMLRTALFSDCRTWRYALWRNWGSARHGRVVLWIGLNPSTADEIADDPTIRRCIGYARRWGYDGICMANLFAFRATKPADMRAAVDPIGPDNDAHLQRLADSAALIIAAWGAHGSHMGRDRAVRDLIRQPLHCLRLTRAGQPAHPLYLPGNLTASPWQEPENHD